MPVKLSSALKKKLGSPGVSTSTQEYERILEEARTLDPGSRSGQQTQFNNHYYNLVTDFFEYGWGKSFHFAPRLPGEGFKASLARHELNMAKALQLGPGMVAADLGCGVGGPLMAIARATGASIVGVNVNEYQLDQARSAVRQEGLSHLADFLQCDFLNVDAADESFDAIYSIEASCCAPDKFGIYSEAFRLLKPGGRFGAYEYCMTDRFDPQDPHHLQVKADLQLGGGLLVIDDPDTVKIALAEAGFEVLEARDLAIQTGPSIPWYQPLVGSGLSLASFRSSSVGRKVTDITVRTLEALHIAPRGTFHVVKTLDLCADAMVEAGRLGIFTPMYFILAQKPRQE
ncbi:MAG: methyltransferase domain-containing protein [Chloroflexota bacterium]|nr:methyltransferase domain-containing protein [Chloroflexota bacterium]